MKRKGVKVSGINGTPQSISWKWLAGTVCGVVLLMVAGYVSLLQGQITTHSVEIGLIKDKLGDQKTEQATTKQKLDQVDRKVDDVKKDVGDIKTTLERILNVQEQRRGK